MSQTSRTARSLVLIGAMALAAPALARNLIIVDGPVAAEQVAGQATDGAVADGAIAGDQLASVAGANGIEPFRAVNATGGLCDSGLQGTSNPAIRIDNIGFDEFTVTSILIKTSGVPTGAFVALSVDGVTVNGLSFDTRSDNLVGPTAGSAVFEAVDLMGTLVRRGSLGGRLAASGGNVPHQIVAVADPNSAEIEVTLFCQADKLDFSITGIAVSGWKFANDDVFVSYIPGS